MPETIRLRTQVGVDRQINVQLDQDFEQLEILSLKVRSEDVYTRMCADYGVIVGRVVANGGYGVPNVRVSVFVPLTQEDAQNEIISTLYPYTSITDVNEDGYRYNLLPYVKSYSNHVPTGSFFDKEDVLINQILKEFKNMAQRIKNDKNAYFIEFKCGVDENDKPIKWTLNDILHGKIYL